MKRRYLVLILLIFLTGCSTEYKLEISNNSFKETINFTAVNPVKYQENEVDIETDDQLTPFIKKKTAALISNDKFYKKKVQKKDDYTQVELKYNFDEDEFKQASSINNCFQYPELDFSDNYYINLQGAFYCLYADSVDIKIETKNKVYYNNADEVQGNTYIWHIDESNIDYVDIKFEVDKGTSMKSIIVVTISLILVILISFIIYKVYKNKKEENDV